MLALLLIFTRSVHFAILSLLSGGLWWAINWFAAEIRAVEGVEREAKAIRERDEKRADGGGGGESAREAQQQEEEEEGTDRTDEDQVEEEKRDSGMRRRDESGIIATRSENGNGNGIERIGGSEVASSMSELDLARGETEGVRKRRIAGDTPGDLSTDSEWDKVSEVEDMDR